MENLNSVNDELDATVEHQEEELEANSEPTEDTDGVDEQEVAEPADGEEKYVQTPEQNAWFAKQRREAEEAKAEAKRMREQTERLQKALQGHGYTGDTDDIADQIEADAQSISVDELRARRKSEAEAAKKLMESDPEIVKLREERDYFYKLQLERIRQDDLNKIKEVYSDVRAKDVSELGEQFAALRASGVDAVVAYSAITQANQAQKVKTPPSIGGVSQSSARIKDYYTPEEVDAFTDADYKDPKKMQAVRNSMTKWK